MLLVQKLWPRRRNKLATGYYFKKCYSESDNLFNLTIWICYSSSGSQFSQDVQILSQCHWHTYVWRQFLVSKIRVSLQAVHQLSTGTDVPQTSFSCSLLQWGEIYICSNVMSMVLILLVSVLSDIQREGTCLVWYKNISENVFSSHAT